MACFLSVRQIHNVSIGPYVFGGPRKDPLFKMEYADLASVDW